MLTFYGTPLDVSTCQNNMRYTLLDMERIAFADWCNDDFIYLQKCLSLVGTREFLRWENANKPEIFSFCLADTTRRNKTKKWQAPVARLVLAVARWRMMSYAIALQSELEDLKTVESVSEMKEIQMAVRLVADCDAIWRGVPVLPPVAQEILLDADPMKFSKWRSQTSQQVADTLLSDLRYNKQVAAYCLNNF